MDAYRKQLPKKRSVHKTEIVLLSSGSKTLYTQHKGGTDVKQSSPWVSKINYKSIYGSGLHV